MVKLLIVFIFFVNLKAASYIESSGIKNPFIYKIYKSTVPISDPRFVIYTLGTLPIIPVPWEHFSPEVKNLLLKADHFITPLTKDDLNSILAQIYRKFIPLTYPEQVMTEEDIQNFYDRNNQNLLALYHDSLDAEIINFAEKNSINSSSLYDEKDVFESFSERYWQYIISGIGAIEDIMKQEFYRFVYPSNIMDAYIDGREDLVIKYMRNMGLISKKSISSQFLNKISLRLNLAAMISQPSYKVFASIPIQYLLGEDGLISLLNQNGYIVEKLFQTQLK